MKKITFLAFLLFTCLTYQIQSQCTDTNTGTGNQIISTSMGQSFEAACTGTVESIGVFVRTVTTGHTLTIYSGDGTGGTNLGSIAFDFDTASTDLTTDYKSIDISSEGIILTNGNLYTFIISGGTGQNLFFNNGDNKTGQLYFNGAAQSGVDLMFNVTLSDVSDTDPPVFENGTPTQSLVNQTTFTLETDIDEAGTIYHVVLPDGATAPTSAEVKAGTGSGGAPAITSGNAVVTTGGFTNDFNIAGLTAGTNYDVYVVAEDDEGMPNLQANPTLEEVTTGALIPLTVIGLTGG